MQKQKVSAGYPRGVPEPANRAMLLVLGIIILLSLVCAIPAYAVPAATPTFSPGGGTYGVTQYVYISDSTMMSTVHYTTNGVDPTATDPIAYMGVPVTVSTSCTLKAKAWATGYDPSSVGSAVYVIQSQVATPTFSPDGGTSSNTVSVTMGCTTTGATIYYTTDGTDPTTSSSVYSSPVSVDRTMTLKAMGWKSGWMNSTIKSSSYTVNVATPTFSVAAGYYDTNQSVTITCATTGATIRYTTDGSTPTSSSTVYSSAISVTDDMTLSAKAFRTGCTDSAVVSADYYIGMTNRVATPAYVYTVVPYGAFPVQITCGTSGAEIRYTEDGSKPSQSQRVLYDPNGRVVIGQTLTLRSRAFKTGMRSSLITVQTFTVYTSSGGTPDDDIYQDNVPAAAPVVQGLTITQIYEPKTIRLDWIACGDNTTVYEVRRHVDGVDTSLGTTTNTFFLDSSSFTLGKNYTYSVRVASGEYWSKGLPAPPTNPPPPDNLVFHRPVWGAGDWNLAIPINTIPEQVASLSGQCVAVDSRYDTRYEDYRLLNFQFGNRTYRGGLFTGNANDPSRVGRSFLKVPLTIPTDRVIYAASMNAYCTRMLTTGTTNVGLTILGSDSWDPMTTAWNNQPTIDPTTPFATSSVSWDSTNPVSSWAHWAIPFSVCTQRQGAGDGMLSMALAATNEASNAWAYFAKPEWDPNYAPHVLYATLSPYFAVGITLNSTSVTGGDVIPGTIYLNGQAPSGGCSVTVGVSNINVAQVVPNPFTVVGSNWSAPFYLSTAVVSSQTTVIVGVGSTSYTVTINP